ncbi:peroxidase 57-like [Trifolium pratense]|uniref:peroxidase 57-like n=1 Tax=Trifolium pratense TaxID=57577 RepID=UPI001E696593|nr:peroxidase 57-like [Trifolium pratense]
MGACFRNNSGEFMAGITQWQQLTLSTEEGEAWALLQAMNEAKSREEIVSEVVQNYYQNDVTIVGALIRLHYHDCISNGCDASILIDSKENRKSEKEARPNLTLRGFNLIDDIKSALEQQCPETVSCADIITMATREAIALANGPRYHVLTGRRDGLVSNALNVTIPGTLLNVPQALKKFNSKGLTLEDMVTLIGAHTIGFSKCNFFQNRLSSFRSGRIDPTMDPNLNAYLVKQCGSIFNPSGNHTSVFLDVETPFDFDNKFYKQIINKRGILKIDQQLALDPLSRKLVRNFASGNFNFWDRFGVSWNKLGRIDVLVGNEGEIRRNCRAFNKDI